MTPSKAYYRDELAAERKLHAATLDRLARVQAERDAHKREVERLTARRRSFGEFVIDVVAWCDHAIRERVGL